MSAKTARAIRDAPEVTAVATVVRRGGPPGWRLDLSRSRSMS